MKSIKPQDFYKQNWRKLEKNELPKIGDAWFPGGFCRFALKPKILDKSDCFDPVGLQDDAIYRNPKDTSKEFWKE